MPQAAVPLAMMAISAGMQVPGMISARKQQKKLSQMQDIKMGKIGEAEQMAKGGPLSTANLAQMAKYREQVRAGQAERGIFSSGVAGAQEAEIMPQIEQSFRQQQANAILGIAGAYDPLISSQAASMAGGGGGGGGEMFGMGMEGLMQEYLPGKPAGEPNAPIIRRKPRKRQPRSLWDE